jgi:hypothetical protein
MPQFGFYMAGVGIAYTGRDGLLIAWDPNDRGPSAADDINWSDIALYSWIGPLGLAPPSLFKMKSKSPVRIPAAGCPATLDGGVNGDYFVRFGVKPGGTGLSLIGDFWLQVFDAGTSEQIYSFAPPTASPHVELADGSVAIGMTEYSMQDRLVAAALEDPLEGWAALIGHSNSAIEIWRELMTPNQLLSWIPSL